MDPVLCGPSPKPSRQRAASLNRLTGRPYRRTNVEILTPSLDPLWNPVTLTNSCVEMANGLNYRNERVELVPAEESLELVPGAALAWKGQTRMALS